MKILILDIETAPNIAYVWRFWKENIAPKQILEHCSLLSFGAKWLEKPKMFYYDTEKNSEKSVLRHLVKLLDEADMVVAHNGARFDLPKIRGRALVHGFPPFSPVKDIDTYKIAKKEFGFDSNSLAYLADVLGCERKGDHGEFAGFELWAACLRGEHKAWVVMKDYNLQDVRTLEQVYLKVRPWSTSHPNVAIYLANGKIACPKCGSEHVQRRGLARTGVGEYPRYQCQNEVCMGWLRGRFTEYDDEKRKVLAVNVIS